MKDVRRDIRFIDSDYKTLFTIKDGESIRITAHDGTELIQKCRYIDELHIKMINEFTRSKLSTDYHICEFAESMEKGSFRYEPFPGQKQGIDILYAKHGQDLQDVTIPMTEAAVKQLMGGGYEAKILTEDKVENRDCFMLRGRTGVAVVGFANGEITSVHPYRAQRYKQELTSESPEMALTPKEQLVDRIEKQYTDYRKSIMAIMDFDKGTIFDMAEKIAAVTDAYTYMTETEYSDTEIEKYLQFENPLEVVADARILINGGYEETTSALDYVTGHFDELIKQYSPAQGTERQAQESQDAGTSIVGCLSYADSDDAVAYFSADHLVEAYKWGMKSFGADGVRFTDVTDSDLERRLIDISEKFVAQESHKSSEKPGILGENGKLAVAKAESERRGEGNGSRGKNEPER